MVVMLVVINVASLSISRTITVFQGLTAFGVPVEIVEFISLAKVALFRGFPFPGATAFAFGGRDLYDGPVVLRVSLNPHDPTGFVVCQGFVADGASAGDRILPSVFLGLLWRTPCCLDMAMTCMIRGWLLLLLQATVFSAAFSHLARAELLLGEVLMFSCVSSGMCTNCEDPGRD